MDDRLLRLGRLGPVLMRVLIAIGALGGLVLDVLGPLDVAGLIPLTSLVAAMGMVVALRHRLAGLGLAIAVSAFATAITHLLGTETMPGFTEMGSLWVLTAAVVRNERPVWVAVGTSGAFLAVALAASRLSHTEMDGFFNQVMLLWFPLLIATGVGLWLRYNDDLGAAMSLNARREERLALARELHDTVAHHVTGIVVQAQAAGVVVGTWSRAGVTPDPAAMARSLSAIEASGAETMAAMRRFVGALRSEGDAPLAPTAGLAELRELVAAAGATGTRVSLSMDDQAVPPHIAPTVFRLVQESLTNVRRHAPHATLVTVDVAPDGAGLAVQVANDGPASWDPPRQADRPGYGLHGLAERLVALGGRLQAGPAPGGGWLVRAWIPV